MPKPWPKLSSALHEHHHIFDLLHERYVSPRNGRQLDAVIIATGDWVNVVAFTEARECVMIRQYRFGGDAITLEIPGGMIDEGEAPLEAAKRELREETGYEAARWTSLGSIAPNPAFQRNRLHTFLAEGCVAVGTLELDPGEDIEVELVAEARIDGLMAEGAMDHALVVVAFLKLALHTKGMSVR